MENIIRDDRSEPFRLPVDWEAFNLWDYPQIIKEPMDLGTMRLKLKWQLYADIWQFNYDMMLVWKNTQLYNLPDSDIHQTSLFFESYWLHNYNILKRNMKESIVSAKGTKSLPIRRNIKDLAQRLTALQLGNLVNFVRKYFPVAIISKDGGNVSIEMVRLDERSALRVLNFIVSLISPWSKS